MGTGQTGDVAKMHSAAKHVDRAGDALAVIRGSIQRAIAATPAGYHSPAADLFRNTMDRWDTDFGHILGELEEIKKKLTQTATHYQATLEEEKHSANKIAALLNGHGGI